ncbi:MAG: YbgC/FadM family acyl-CoA thioesterase [Candidatus Omnitrophica bacterium]|nr:YbgC/FadM family acyl-CoA thioesterase [Candidatus Omnitrophota bacterium]
MHCHKKKIYYHDTDCGGVVYYANYLKYLEEARTEFFAANKIDLKELSKQGTLFVVSSVEMSYRSPARYGDEIGVYTSIEKARSASLMFFQEIKRGDMILAECRTLLVCVNGQMSPQIIPSSLKESLA